MRARSAKQASSDCRSAQTSSASIAVDGPCPLIVAGMLSSITSLAIAFFIAGRRAPSDDAKLIARGLATKQQVSGTQARAAACAAHLVVPFHASSPVAG